MNKYWVMFLAVCGVSLSAIAALRHDSNTVQLRFTSAHDAYTALKEHLGADEGSAVTSVDVRSNALEIAGNHPQAAKAREFLAAFDVRPAQFQVQAVISRRIEAAPAQEAHDVVLSRPTAVVREGDRLVFSVPGEGGVTNIELRIHSIPAER